jgi:putative hydrolase of the HAD superfamily
VAHRAVIFDLGGVVLGSPLHAIAEFEREHGIPEGFVNRVVVETGAGGAWARLERGELELAAFVPAFEADCAAAGRRIAVGAMMARMSETARPRPLMLEAIRRIRANGLLAAALTNNWSSGDGTDTDDGLREHFDAFFESSVLGLQKPDPRIYRHACVSLGIDPAEAVFLDDIGRNLKAARELGMATIKVAAVATALAELEALVGIALPRS